MIYFTEKPPGFAPRMVVVGCFVVLKEEQSLLLLKRHPHKPQPHTWGIPSGKVNGSEPLSEAMRRELWEETRIRTHIMQYLGCANVRYDEYDFVYHMFAISVTPAQQDVVIKEEEHVDFRWSTPQKAKEMPLIEDLGSCIDQFRVRIFQ